MSAAAPSKRGLKKVTQEELFPYNGGPTVRLVITPQESHKCASMDSPVPNTSADEKT